jgi:hypothetical protein
MEKYTKELDEIITKINIIQNKISENKNYIINILTWVIKPSLKKELRQPLLELLDKNNYNDFNVLLDNNKDKLVDCVTKNIYKDDAINYITQEGKNTLNDLIILNEELKHLQLKANAFIARKSMLSNMSLIPKMNINTNKYSTIPKKEQKKRNLLNKIIKPRFSPIRRSLRQGPKVRPSNKTKINIPKIYREPRFLDKGNYLKKRRPSPQKIKKGLSKTKKKSIFRSSIKSPLLNNISFVNSPLYNPSTSRVRSS